MPAVVTCITKLQLPAGIVDFFAVPNVLISTLASNKSTALVFPFVS